MRCLSIKSSKKIECFYENFSCKIARKLGGRLDNKTGFILLHCFATLMSIQRSIKFQPVEKSSFFADTCYVAKFYNGRYFRQVPGIYRTLWMSYMSYNPGSEPHKLNNMWRHSYDCNRLDIILLNIDTTTWLDSSSTLTSSYNLRVLVLVR